MIIERVADGRKKRWVASVSLYIAFYQTGSTIHHIVGAATGEQKSTKARATTSRMTICRHPDMVTI
jgi:hypothetical protein